MPKMSELGSYVVLFFLVIVLFAVSFAPITGYIAAVSGGGVDVRNAVDSNGTTRYSSYYPGTDLRKVVDSIGAKYVEDEVIDRFSRNDEVRVIIKFRGDTRDLNLNGRGFEKKREFENSLSGNLEKTGLVRLIDSLGDEIESIQVDHELISMSDVDGAVPKIRADWAWDLGLTGKGQTVCVIDTGIDYNNESFSDRYIGGYDFVNNDNDPMDDYGHGTYISDIISNIAPGAKIIAAKALGSNGRGYESDIIAAIDYCIENRYAYGVSVISLAISGGGFEGYCDSVLVTKEANLASEQGIFVVAAAGNKRSDNLTAPACGTKVTSVGAATTEDSISFLTNINPLLDLLAPSMSIISPRTGCRPETGGGTSAATAIVAGAALLVLESESLKPMELEYRFRSTGFVIEHKGTDYPRVDVHNAINNMVTNTPSEQAGEQSEGKWVEYGPALPDCECFIDNECPDYPDAFCDDATQGECSSGDWGNRLCSGCVGEGGFCGYNPNPWQDWYCNQCPLGPWVCQWE
jgi:subtilisin family serine protease